MISKTAGALLACSLLQLPLFADPVLWYVRDTVTGNYGVSLGPTDTTHSVPLSQDSGQVQTPILTTTAGGTDTETDPNGRHYLGSLSLQGSVAPGDVHGIIQSAGLTTNSLNDPFEQYGAGGSASLTQFWSDTITVGGLPSGTAVDLDITDVLHSLLSGTVGGGVSASARSILTATDGVNTILANFSIFNSLNGPPVDNITQTQVIHTFSGDTITLFGEFVLSDSADVAYIYPGVLSASSGADASDTNDTFLSVITPGASFTSASGATYVSTAVPEPSSLYTVGAVILALGAYALRRAASSVSR